MRFGILGLGRFGQCWAKLMIPFGSVVAYDPLWNSSPLESVTLVSFEEVLLAEVVFFLVPISSFRECCQKVALHVAPSTLLVDACSVKMFPLQIMRETFSPEQPLMSLHPLFGPDSIRTIEDAKGRKIILCTKNKEKSAQNMRSIFASLGLETVFLSPQEHDTHMAQTQALAHFLGRIPILAAKKEKITTPSFELLNNMVASVTQDQEDLFLDMHRYNPFARGVREKFLGELLALHQSLGNIENLTTNMSGWIASESLSCNTSSIRLYSFSSR
jgi:prephenate dehydrogenase